MSSHNNAVPRGPADDDGEAEHYAQHLQLPLNDGRTLNLPVHKLIWIQSGKGNTTNICFWHPETHEKDYQPYGRSIGCLEKYLQHSRQFLRLHKKHIINFNEVLYFDWHNLQAELYIHEKVSLSLRYKKRYNAYICNSRIPANNSGKCKKHSG